MIGTRHGIVSRLGKHDQNSRLGSADSAQEPDVPPKFAGHGGPSQIRHPGAGKSHGARLDLRHPERFIPRGAENESRQVEIAAETLESRIDHLVDGDGARVVGAEALGRGGTCAAGGDHEDPGRHPRGIPTSCPCTFWQRARRIDHPEVFILAAGAQGPHFVAEGVKAADEAPWGAARLREWSSFHFPTVTAGHREPKQSATTMTVTAFIISLRLLQQKHVGTFFRSPDLNASSSKPRSQLSILPESRSLRKWRRPAPRRRAEAG